MALTKPTDKPVWAEDNVNLPIATGTNKIQPRVNWRTTGVDKNDYAAAQEFNWQFDNIDDWVDYFEQEIESNDTDITQIRSELDNEVMKEGENVSLLNNDANYVSSGDNVSDLINDANYVSSGDNVSDLTNDATYQSLSQVNTLIDAAKELLYPVGHILISTNTANPNTYLGFGTWVQTAEGRFIIGQDTGDNDFDVIGETGGSKTQSFTVSRDGWGEAPSNGPLPSPSTDERLVVGSGQTELTETLESLTHAGNDISTSSESIVPPYQVMIIFERTV